MQFEKSSVIRALVSEVFAFHEHPDALTMLIPPWDPSKVLTPPSSLEVGTVVVLETWVGPFRQRIEAEHTAYEHNQRFVDEMRRGPFARWRHEHLFAEHAQGCLLTDRIDYAAPLGLLGRLVDPILIRPRLQRMFDYRHRVTAQAVERGV